MTILNVDKVTRYFGARVILKNVTFQLSAGEKAGLVGANGSGKTTLLRILAGELEPDEGKIVYAPGCRVGYLSQDMIFNPSRTVEEEAWAALGHLKQWEEELRQLEARMGEVAAREAVLVKPGEKKPEMDSLLRRYAWVMERFEAGGGYQAAARVQTVLAGLGFSRPQLDLPVSKLSGGQKIRLGLAKVLLAGPDLLLLDEPTNHLDLPAIEWLEGFLKSYRGAVLLVSHDRVFLDRVTEEILELEGGTVTLYPGNFSFYEGKRREREEKLRAEWEMQQDEIKRLKGFIARFQAGTRARLAKDRAKKLERLKPVEKPKGARRRMSLHFAPGKSSGRDVLEVNGLTATLGGVTLFANLNLKVQKGERVALVGPNGAGKTTFLKILLGTIQPTAGSFRWGQGVQLGYFSQDLDQLDPSKTPLQEFLALPGMTPYVARSLLGRFLFGEEEVSRTIGGMSGGERNRLALARLVLSGANVLLLDEPTNHLDIPSRELLEEALLSFPGTVLLVSHDRHLLNRVATRILILAGGALHTDPGKEQNNVLSAIQPEETYAFYNSAAGKVLTAPGSVSGQLKEPFPEGRHEKTLPGAASTRPGRDNRSSSPATSAQKVRLEQLTHLEEEISRTEARKGELQELFSRPQELGGSLVDLAREYEALEKRLEKLYADWAELAASLE